MVKRSARAASRAPLNTTIISTIAKPIATKELIARLQAVADNLSTADQNAINPEDYNSLAGDLANKKLLKHNHKGVLAYACCALADILRLYAPDAPYTPEQLTQIFRAFLVQFSQLWEEQNPYFLQQCYLLKRLVEVRLIILIVDLPDALDLIAELFDTMFALTNKGFPTRLELLASEMLAEVFAEADVIPQKVVRLLLKKLTATSESGLTVSNSNISNPGLAFSLAVCEANVDKMSRHIAQLFSEMLDDSVKANKNGSTDYEASYLALEKIHTWSIQIWRYVPDLLTSVMGLISDELNSDSERVRVLATTTIGSMVSSSNEGSPESNLVHFVNTHKAAWLNWLKKSSDVSPVVRAKWVEQVPNVLCAQSVTSDTTSQLSSSLTKCLSDTNERVRFASCNACEALPFAVFSSKVCSEAALSTLFQLVREKNSDIHNVAIRLLADIYNSYLDLIERDEVVDFGDLKEEELRIVEKLLSVDLPNNLLQLNYVNEKSLTAVVDIALFEKLISFQENTSKRVSRLCKFYEVLDEKSRASFLAVISRQKKMSDAVRKFVELSIEYMKSHSLEGENKENEAFSQGEKEQLRSKVDKVIQWLTASFPPSLNSRQCLERFHHLRNARLFNLMGKCVAPDANFKSVKNSLKELLTKLGDAKTLRVEGGSLSVTTADMVSTTKILLYRSSNILFNLTNTSELVKLSKDKNHKFQKTANELINHLSTIFPEVFRDQIKALSDLIVIRKEDIEVSLIQSFSHFMNKYPEQFPDDAEFAESLQLLATEGSPLQAKYAIKIIRCSDRKELLISNVIDKIMPLVPESSSFATHLSALAEIYLALPIALESYSNEISSILVEEVLRKNRIEDLDKLLIKSEVWLEDSKLRDDHQALRSLNEKLIAIRLITNRVRSVDADGMEQNEMAVVAEKPLKLLMTVVSNSGEIVKARPDLLPTPPCFKQRLRLEAGLNILKLAKYPAFNMMINNTVIYSLTRLLHDESSGVRDGFMRSLEKKLSLNAISERFLHLVFFAGHEPNEQIKRKASIWIASNHRRREEKSDITYERILARLIHAIAHDIRFSKMIAEVDGRTVSLEVEAYLYALSYISMYLDIIAKEENISLLYYIASRVKQYRDGQVDPEMFAQEELPDAAMNLYRISELCQLLIKELADSRGWNLQTWPGKMKLPSDLFAPMEDYQEAQKVISRVYISDEVQIELRQNLKKNPTKASNKRKAPSSDRKPSASRNSTKLTSRKKQKRVKIDVDGDDDDGDDEILDEDSTPLPPRRSSRNRSKVKYTEAPESDDEDEAEVSDAEISE